MPRCLLLIPYLALALAATPCRAEDATRAAIRSITARSEGGESRLEIAADKPLTFIYYTSGNPLRHMVSFAEADPGDIKPLVLDPSGLIATVSVERKVISGLLVTRLVVETNTAAEMAASYGTLDRTSVIMSFTETNPVKLSARIAGSKPEAPAAAVPSPALPETDKGAAAALPAATPTLQPGKPTQTDKPEQHVTGIQPAPPAVTVTPAPAAKTPAVSPAPLPPLPAVSVPPPSRTAITGVAIKKGEVTIATSSRGFTYKAFSLASPNRIVIDIENGRNLLGKKRFTGASAVAVRIGEYPQKVRVVIDTDKVKPVFQIRENGNGLQVFFNSPD